MKLVEIYFSLKLNYRRQSSFSCALWYLTRNNHHVYYHETRERSSSKWLGFTRRHYTQYIKRDGYQHHWNHTLYIHHRIDIIRIQWVLVIYTLYISERVSESFIRSGHTAVCSVLPEFQYFQWYLHHMHTKKDSLYEIRREKGEYEVVPYSYSTSTTLKEVLALLNSVLLVRKA